MPSFKKVVNSWPDVKSRLSGDHHTPITKKIDGDVYVVGYLSLWNEKFDADSDAAELPEETFSANQDYVLELVCTLGLSFVVKTRTGESILMEPGPDVAIYPSAKLGLPAVKIFRARLASPMFQASLRLANMVHVAAKRREDRAEKALSDAEAGAEMSKAELLAVKNAAIALAQDAESKTKQLNETKERLARYSMSYAPPME